MRPSGLGVAAVLALLAAVGPISTDMYLPAFGAMRADLGGGAAAAPLTLAAWFFGLALGQLVLGPLSDRVGRRLPLLLGGALYTIACAACALSASMHQLIAWRLLAALGGAASIAVPRAIIGDISEGGQDAARIVSRVQVIMSAAPMFTPVLGGWLVQSSGWRAIFWVAAGYGLLCMLVVATALRETLPPPARSRIPVSMLTRHVLRVGAERAFALNVLTAGFATFGLFAFLGGAPVVFLRHLGMSPALFGATFIANGAAYAIGTVLNAGLVGRFGRPPVLTCALCALAAAAGAMLLLALAGQGAWGVEGPFVVIMLMLGCVLPDAAIGAIGPHLEHAGVASALYGTVTFAIGAAGSTIAGFIVDADPAPMALLLLFGAVSALVVHAGAPR